MTNWTPARARRLFDIRPDEARPALLVALYLATVVAAFLLAKTIRSGLFLAEHGAQSLVYVYASVPIAVTALVPLHTRWAKGRGQRVGHLGTLAFFGLTFLGFWFAFTYTPFPLLPAVFYVWVNCYGVIAPVQVWMLASAVFDTRQARRLFGFIAGGASLGSVVAGLLASTLVPTLGGSANLILLVVVLIGVAAGLVALGGWERAAAPPRVASAPLRGALGAIGRDPHLCQLAVLVFLVAIVTQWTEFQMSLVADQTQGGDADQLTVFFGRFNLVLGLVAFLLQFATGPTLRRFGIGVGVLCLPVALGAGSILILLAPAVAAVLLTKGLDQGLRFSIDKASYELLYVPVDARIRAGVKATIDVIVSRTADLVGAAVLWLVTSGVVTNGAGLGLRGTAAINLALIGVWLIVAAKVRGGYVRQVESRIREHRLDGDRVAGLPTERATEALIAERLHAEDPRDVIYALDLIAAQVATGRRSHPSVRFLLEHPRAEVRRKALSVLRADEEAGAVPLVEPMLGDPDLEVRTEALLFVARHSQTDPLTRIEEIGDFHDFSVRAGVVAFLARPSPAQNLEAAETLLDTMVAEAGETRQRTRLEAARLLSLLPHEFRHQLTRLLEDDNAAVVRAALRAAGDLKATSSLGTVLDRLGDARYVSPAGDVLVGWGEPIVDTLGERLSAAETPASVRRELPGVLLRIGGARAQRVLVAGLLSPEPDVRHEVVASLNKLRSHHSEVSIDLQTVEMALAAEVVGHYRSYQVLVTLEGNAAGASALDGLRQAMDAEQERIFRLLALLFPEHDLHSAHDGIRSESAAVRANAVEFLDNVLEPAELRAQIMPLVDDQVSTVRRAAAGRRVTGATVRGPEQAVRTLLASEDSWLRSCGLVAIGTLELRQLEPELDRALASTDERERTAARAAKTRLAPEHGDPVPGADEGEHWRSSGPAGVG